MLRELAELLSTDWSIVIQNDAKVQMLVHEFAKTMMAEESVKSGLEHALGLKQVCERQYDILGTCLSQCISSTQSMLLELAANGAQAGESEACVLVRRISSYNRAAAKLYTLGQVFTKIEVECDELNNTLSRLKLLVVDIECFEPMASWIQDGIRKVWGGGERG